MVAWVLAANSWLLAQDAPPQPKAANGISVNQDSLTIQDFSKRVDDYVKLRKRMRKQACRPKIQKFGCRPQTISSSPWHRNISAERSQAKAGRYFHSCCQPAFQKIDRDALREQRWQQDSSQPASCRTGARAVARGQSAVSANVGYAIHSSDTLVGSAKTPPRNRVPHRRPRT